MTLVRNSGSQSARRMIVGAVGAVSVCVMAPTASAQWTVVNLHPQGASESLAHGVGGSQQVGSAKMGGVVSHASLWTGSAASWVDLHPAGATWYSLANGVDGGHQVGDVGGQASLWSGSAGSWVDLHPFAFATNSSARGVHGGHQVGSASVGGVAHASLWTGTAASWVDLHPAAADWSVALEVHDSKQVGYAFLGGYRASLWSGTAASWVDLTPAGTGGSGALGVFGGQQVGEVYFGAIGHASLWSGTAASWVDLHPAAAQWSFASDVYDSQQVGVVDVGGVRHASLWNGTAASWVDLHALLPAGFSSSDASGIWSDANVTLVVGQGFNSATNRYEAVLWKRAACYPDCNADGSLTVADFGCFQTKFVLGDPYADCNQDGQHTVADFGCFQTKFVLGCP